MSKQSIPPIGWYAFAKGDIGFVVTHLLSWGKLIFVQNLLDHLYLGVVRLAENYGVIGKEEVGNNWRPLT